MRASSATLCGATLALLTATPAFAAIDWTKVNAEFGRAGAEQPGGTQRYSFPRSDLKVMLDGVEVKAGLALGSWLAFQPMQGNDAMVMGDLVLTQDEIAPVTKKLLEGGIDVTAIHNHLIRAEPLPMYVHIEGRGDAVRLAHALQEAMALSKTPPAAPAAAGAPADPGFNMDAIAAAMGRKGTLDGAVYKYNIARAETVQERGMTVPITQGTGIAINFQAAGAGKVATTGDFVLAANEITAVARALRDAGIEVTALHSHMMDEEPRLSFMHFWAVGTPEAVAGGLRKALNLVATQQAAAN